MGIFTWIQIVGMVLLLGVCSYYVWSYHHMKTEIISLKNEVASLKTKAEIIEKAQKATDVYQKKQTVFQKKGKSDNVKTDQLVEANDNVAIRKLFIDRGMLNAPTGTTTGGTKGNTRNLSP